MLAKYLQHVEQPAPGCFFHSRLLTIVPSWHCDATCRHCFIPEKIRRHDIMATDTVRSALYSLPSDIKAVSFTGGEPFLHPRRLMNLVALSSKKGRPSAVVTNGIWFTRNRQPRQLLERLFRAGLRGISISVDTYHRPPLRDEQVIDLLKEARALGMAINIRGAGKEAYRRAERIKRSGVLDDLEGSERFFGLENVGQAKRLPLDRKQDRRKLESCLAATQPLIMPDGKVLACCSAHMFRIKNDVLEIGHIKNESLDKILARSRHSYLLAALAAGGPMWLSEILGRKIKTTNRTRCELCLEILNDKANVNELTRCIAGSKDLRKEIAGRMMVWEHCYRPELLPQFQSGV